MNWIRLSSSVTGVLIRKQPCENRCMQGKVHVAAKADIGVVHRQAKNAQTVSIPLEAGEEARKVFPIDIRGGWPCGNLELGLLASRTLRQ